MYRSPKEYLQHILEESLTLLQLLRRFNFKLIRG
jgi:hypothetical protein